MTMKLMTYSKLAAVKASVGKWPWLPPNNSKQVLQENNFRWKYGGRESDREPPLGTVLQVKLNIANLSNFSCKNVDQNERNVIIPPLSLGFIVVVLWNLEQREIFWWVVVRGPKISVFLVNVAVGARQDLATLFNTRSKLYASGSDFKIAAVDIQKSHSLGHYQVRFPSLQRPSSGPWASKKM